MDHQLCSQQAWVLHIRLSIVQAVFVRSRSICLFLNSSIYIHTYNYYLMYHYEEPSLSQSARQNFVKKVYAIISMQLSVTIAFVWLNFYFKSFARFQRDNTWTFWLAFIGSLISLVSLFFGKISRSTPINYVMISVFTLCESYLVSFLCSMYTASSVLLSASATLAATIGLTYYAMTTKEDFTTFRFIGKGIISSVIWIALTVSLINLFFIRSSIITMGIAALFAVIYSVYILIDTQMILGGRHNQVQLDDYILGATVLYVDIISLFLKLLQLLGKKKDD